MHAISARAGDGIAEIEQYFAGNRTVGLIGSSGVGKSTLTNELSGTGGPGDAGSARARQPRPSHDDASPAVLAAARRLDHRHARHAWRRAVASGEQLWKQLRRHRDIALECKFSNCRHEAEPKCAVRAAVARGDLDAERVAGYVRRAREAKLSAR